MVSIKDLFQVHEKKKLSLVVYGLINLEPMMEFSRFLSEFLCITALKLGASSYVYYDFITLSLCSCHLF